MSHHPMNDNDAMTPERMFTRRIEAGAALYALDHASKGTPVGAEEDFAAQSATPPAGGGAARQWS